METSAFTSHSWIIIFVIGNFGLKFVELIDENGYQSPEHSYSIQRQKLAQDSIPYSEFAKEISEGQHIFASMKSELKAAQRNNAMKKRNWNSAAAKIVDKRNVEEAFAMSLPNLDKPDFAKSRELHEVYIDKTKYLQRLLKGKRLYNFLTRPRRFGKSFLISMMKNFFSGRKDLFKGLDIEQECPEKVYPVIVLDFAAIPSTSANEFRKAIGVLFIDAAASYGVNDIQHDLAMETIIRKVLYGLHAKMNVEVVVLIDEYDSPYMKSYQQPQNEEVLHALGTFFTQLKIHHMYLHFCFVTGTTKTSVTPFFSGIEKNDITMNPEYAAIAGFTKEELNHFDPWIKIIADAEAKGNITAIKENMTMLFNGYRFSPSEETVSNPAAIISYLKSKGANKNYWTETGSEFYMKKLREAPLEYMHLVPLLSVNSSFHSQYSLKVSESSLERHVDIKGRDFESLLVILYHAGYLSIFKNCTELNQICPSYSLRFPNMELKNEYVKRISELVLKKNPYGNGDLQSTLMEYGRNARVAMDSNEWEKFIEILNTYYAEIPWTLFRDNTKKDGSKENVEVGSPEDEVKEKRPKEKFYQLLFHCVMAAAGFNWIKLEDLTSLGQADVVMASATTIYIVETKLEENDENPIIQCFNKYAPKYKNRDKEICCIGLVFSEDKQIHRWGVLVLSQKGTILREYGMERLN